MATEKKYLCWGKYKGQTVGTHDGKLYVRGYNERGDMRKIALKHCERNALIIALLQVKK